MSSLIQPRARYYGIGATFLVLSGFVGGHFYRQRIEAIPVGLTQGVVPGSMDLDFPEAGHGTIFLEYRSVVGDGLFLTPDDPGSLACTLVSVTTGEEVGLEPALVPIRYALDQRSGRALYDFWIETAGTYRLRGEYPPGTTGGSMVLAGGYGLLGDLSSTILGSLGVALGLAAVGFVALAIVAARRSRTRREIYGRFGR